MTVFISFCGAIIMVVGVALGTIVVCYLMVKFFLAMIDM
jgi:hypothetical protein